MKRFSLWVLVSMVPLLLLSNVSADEINAAEAETYTVLNRDGQEITIDARFDDWRFARDVLVMGKDTWEPFQGGTWKNAEDLTVRLQIVWDTENLYFALRVTDDEYLAEGGNPWSNDGIQMAIDVSGGEIPPGLTGSTHLYNFSIKDGWQMENGNFKGEAEIVMERDDALGQSLFEWRMPAEIMADKGTVFEAGMEIAFAIIVNDSDKDAPGQTGWVGWGSHTIVFGKNPEEMKTLILSDQTLTVEPRSKLTTLWGRIKR